MRAFARRELVLRYQPIVDVGVGRLRRVEALVRWAHPRHGVLSPDQFVGAASRLGHLRLLSRYVIRVALEQVAAWRAAGLQIAVAVNVDAADFRDNQLVPFIAASLGELDLAPSALMLEITERGSFDDDARTLRNIHAIRRLGVTFAIDDF